MISNAARQRTRRERLRMQGIVDVTVSAPEAARPLLRSLSRSLCAGGVPMISNIRLLLALDGLKDIRNDLTRRGVRRAGVFGSTARGMDTLESDVDIVIDLDMDHAGDVLDLVNTADQIAAAVQVRCPGVKVEVVDLSQLKPAIRARVEKEAVYAF